MMAKKKKKEEKTIIFILALEESGERRDYELTYEKSRWTMDENESRAIV